MSTVLQREKGDARSLSTLQNTLQRWRKHSHGKIEGTFCRMNGGWPQAISGMFVHPCPRPNFSIIYQAKNVSMLFSEETMLQTSFAVRYLIDTSLESCALEGKGFSLTNMHWAAQSSLRWIRQAGLPALNPGKYGDCCCATTEKGRIIPTPQ